MTLPKVIVDRIHRYAAEGSQLCAFFGPRDYRLLAVAMGQIPVVILRASNAEQFAEMRSQVFVEWSLTSRKLKRRR